MANPQERDKTTQPVGIGADSITSQEIEALDKDIEIYVMPERFRYSNIQTKQSNKMGVLIVIVGGILIIGLSVGMYFYFFAPKKPIRQTENNTQPAAEEQAPVAEQPKEPEKPKETPKEAYLKLKAPNTDSSASPLVADIGGITEEVNGDYATLKATTTDGSRIGVINMALSNGDWSITSENWITVAKETAATSTPEQATSTPEITLKPGIDMDGDGLTDKEEAVLGSNPNLTDSDGDTFPDFSEFYKLYNPAGPGKLTDNKNIAVYQNKTFGYSLYYPSPWTVTSVGTDESVIFRSLDNQFIQVVVQTNVGHDPIDAWYKRTFNVTDIDSQQIVSQVAWNGIKSPDGLNVYITDKNHRNIYTLSYNTAQSEYLDYINFFNLAVITFTLK